MAFNITSYGTPSQPQPAVADMQRPSIPVTGGVNNVNTPGLLPTPGGPMPSMPQTNPGGQMMPQQAQAMMPQFGNQPGPPKLGNNANAMGRQQMMANQLRKQYAGPTMGGGGAVLGSFNDPNVGVSPLPATGPYQKLPEQPPDPYGSTNYLWRGTGR